MEPFKRSLHSAEVAGQPGLSVVCPFFNESGILEHALRSMLAALDDIPTQSELIVVDDGSVDGSGAIARRVAAEDDRLRVLSYPVNRGRGHALRTGIAQARSDIVVTTEIDLSWGADIVARLYQAITERPDVDIVVASPHLPGGGYRNVPFKRVLLSRLGNHVIRACMSNAVTMNTGMTRAYRRDALLSLPLHEDKKEFHLEVILKAQAFNYRFHEIPAVLEWQSHKHEGKTVKRKSSSRVNKLILTHSLFSLFANPIRYVWGLGFLAALCSLAFLAVGLVRYSLGLVSVYMAIVSLTFAVIALMLFAFGVLAQQGKMIQTELWRLKQDLDKSRRSVAAAEESAARNQAGVRTHSPVEDTAMAPR